MNYNRRLISKLAIIAILLGTLLMLSMFGCKTLQKTKGYENYDKNSSWRDKL